MTFSFSTRSPLERIQRYIKHQKFNKTLPSRLDRAERDWHAQQRDQLAKPELIEHEPDGSEAQSLLGGALQARHTFLSKDESI